MNNENKEIPTSIAITQNIIRYAQALGTDAAIYFGTSDQNLASPQRKEMVITDLKMLKVQIDILDKLLV